MESSRPKPGAHLLRHLLTPEAQSAAAAAFPQPLDAAGAAILQLRQPTLRRTFAQVFGVHTTSGNNDWMRGKLLQARGLSAKWRPPGQEAQPQATVSPTNSQCGSPAGSGKASSAQQQSQRSKRAPQCHGADGAGAAARGAHASVAGGQLPRAAAAAYEAASLKRSRSSPGEFFIPAAYLANGSAACHTAFGAAPAPPPPQVLVVVVSNDQQSFMHTGLHEAAAAAAATQSPFARAGKAGWAPSPDGLSRQGSHPLPADCFHAAAPAAAGAFHRQAALAALQALGMPHAQAHIITAEQLLHGGQANVGPEAAAAVAALAHSGSGHPQAAPAAPASSSHMQRSSSVPVRGGGMAMPAQHPSAAAAAHAASAAQERAAQQASRQAALAQMQHSQQQQVLPTPFAGFWGNAAQAAGHVVPPAWQPFATSSSVPSQRLARAGTMPAHLAAPQAPSAAWEPAAMASPFAGWASASAPATVPGSPRAHERVPTPPTAGAAGTACELSRAASATAPSPFACQAEVPLGTFDAPDRPDSPLAADISLLALGDLSEWDLPSFLDKHCSSDEFAAMFLADSGAALSLQQE